MLVYNLLVPNLSNSCLKIEIKMAGTNCIETPPSPGNQRPMSYKQMAELVTHFTLVEMWVGVFVVVVNLSNLQ
jgi:hypothetical protein